MNDGAPVWSRLKTAQTDWIWRKIHSRVPECVVGCLAIKFLFQVIVGGVMQHKRLFIQVRVEIIQLLQIIYNRHGKVNDVQPP